MPLLREAINRSNSRLTKTDRRLLQELLANPTEGAFLSAQGLAERTKVHPTTAVRLARKLGFQGYPQLRSQLQSEIIATSKPAERIRRRLSIMGGDSILKALVESEISALHELPNQIDERKLTAAAQALIDARRIYLFGIGHSTALVDLFGRRLRRSGYDAVGFTHYGWETAERICALGAQDALLAFAFRAIPEGIGRLFEHARKVGAVCISISDLIGPTIHPEPHILLAASRGKEGESQSLTVPMAICNALILKISHLDNGKSLSVLSRLGKLKAKFNR